MKKTFCSCSLALFVVTVNSKASDVTYNWTGVDGFTASITLDASSSTQGGVGDVVSVYVDDPDGFGPIATYATPSSKPGVNNPATPFNASDVTTYEPLTWTGNQITSMGFYWSLDGGEAGITLQATPSNGCIAFYNGNVPLTEADTTGKWQAPQSAPDSGSTAALLGIACAGLGLVRRKLS